MLPRAQFTVLSQRVALSNNILSILKTHLYDRSLVVHQIEFIHHKKSLAFIAQVSSLLTLLIAAEDTYFNIQVSIIIKVFINIKYSINLKFIVNVSKRWNIFFIILRNISNLCQKFIDYVFFSKYGYINARIKLYIKFINRSGNCMTP